MFEWDAKVDIVRASARMADIFGLRREEAERGLPLKAYGALMHPNDRDRVAQRIRRQTEGVIRLRYTIVRPDGARLAVGVKGYCFCDDDGQPLRHVGMLHLGGDRTDPVEMMIDSCLDAYELAAQNGHHMIRYLLGMTLMELGFDLAGSMRGR